MDAQADFALVLKPERGVAHTDCTVEVLNLHLCTFLAALQKVKRPLMSWLGYIAAVFLEERSEIRLDVGTIFICSS